MTTTKKTGDTVTEESQTTDVNFQKPQVRGLLYDLVATKTDGTSALSGATFGLFNENGDKMVDAKGQVTENAGGQYKVQSDDNGQIVFQNLPWGKYMVKEITPPAGYQLNTESWTVTVCYTTNSEALVASTVNEKNAMVNRGEDDPFVNVPATEPVTMKVAKKLDGRAGMDGDVFTFTLTPKSDNAPMPADENGTTPTSLTTTIDMSSASDGEPQDNSFQEIPIPVDRAGTYEYTIAETNNGEVSGLNYSKAEYTATVTVDGDENITVTYKQVKDDNGDDVTSATPSSETPVFTNRPATAYAGVDIEKVLVGRPWNDLDEFTFQVQADDLSYPLPDNVDANGRVTVNKANDEYQGNEATRVVDLRFDALPYLGSDTTYKYTVTEVTGSADGIVYSKAKWQLIITVRCGEDGTVKSEVEVKKVLDDDGKSPTISTNALNPTMDFTNRFISVSSLPLTGGRSTARTLLLSGGGVLLVAGAAWLLARRRRV